MGEYLNATCHPFFVLFIGEYDEILLKNSTELLDYNKSLYEVLRNRVCDGNSREE